MRNDYLKHNYLEGPALKLVKEIDSLELIWKRLKQSFGCVDTLLANKFKLIENSDPLWNLKSDEDSVIDIKNVMQELSSLAEKHCIENNLFHVSNLAKIYFLIGKKRQTEIMKILIENNSSEKESWAEIIKYLDNEVRVKEQIILFNRNNPIKSEVKERKLNFDKSLHSHFAKNDDRCVTRTDHVPSVTNSGKKLLIILPVKNLQIFHL